MHTATRKWVLQNYYDNRERYAALARSLNQSVDTLIPIKMNVRSVTMCLVIWDIKEQRFTKIKVPSGTPETPLYETIEL